MHLMYTLDASGKRIYTLKKVVSGEVTKSAHPARFSPDDKYSRHRVTLKKRYGLLLTQQSEFVLQLVVEERTEVGRLKEHRDIMEMGLESWLTCMRRRSKGLGTIDLEGNER